MEAGVNWLLELGEATTAVQYCRLPYNRRQCCVSVPTKPQGIPKQKLGN
jgi:hypothetical protein